MGEAATISGPTTGAKGPWSAPSFDLAALGYVMEEHLIEGVASRFVTLDGNHDSNGRWDAVVAGESPYRTRILVVRPEDPAKFNGTVIMTWLNVTAGYEHEPFLTEELASGFAWVAVSVQRIGIEGYPEGFEYTGRLLPQDPLRRWDPERYGTLQHPGDAFAFDIFSQAGSAVRAGAGSPLGELGVERVIATGPSQSALMLTSYINGVHPLAEVFDGYLLTITPGLCMPLEEPASMLSAQVRDDLGVPVLIVNSEWEAPMMQLVRRDDSESFRFWEVAGAPHAVAVPGATAPRADGRDENPLALAPVVSAAYRRMHEWVADGTPPQRMPRLEFAADGSGLTRDPFGNAIGGVRLPELQAPIAEYHGNDEEAPGLQGLYGWSRPFTTEELASLYPSLDAYRERYRAAVDELVGSGVLSPDGAREKLAQLDEIELDLG